MKPSVRNGLAAVLLVASLSLAGCAQRAAVSPDPDPVQVQAIPGSDLHRVTLSQIAERNLGIQTELVRRATPTTSTSKRSTAAQVGASFVPMTAVVYDPKGASWVYVALADRTYTRSPIVIDHASARDAFLKSGPPVDTAIVTVGAPELLGAEYGVGGE